MSRRIPEPRLTPETLLNELGPLDIYLFDQILKGRLPPGTRILDAGCGGGRNLLFFLRNGYPVSGTDTSRAALTEVRAQARRLAPELPEDAFRTDPVEELSFPDAAFDAVIASAVLHFARDEDHFRRMVAELWRVLAPRGMLFARLATTVGLENRVVRLEGRRFRLPDGSERFLADEALLEELASELDARTLEPLKTTLVARLRAMTTWVVEKL